MPRLIVFLLLPLHAFALATQSLSISYFDQEEIKFRIPNLPNFLKLSNSRDVEKGFMIFYEKRLLDFALLSAYIGCDVGKWTLNNDRLYTTSAFLAGRVWFFHISYFHPYAEYSLFGPTILSKEHFADIHFKSNLLFQNFFTVGIELGDHQGFNLSIKFLKYSPSNLSCSTHSFQAPTLLSAGILF